MVCGALGVACGKRHQGRRGDHGEEDEENADGAGHDVKERRTPRRCRAGSLNFRVMGQRRTMRAVAVRPPCVSLRMWTPFGRSEKSRVPRRFGPAASRWNSRRPDASTTSHRTAPVATSHWSWTWPCVGFGKTRRPPSSTVRSATPEVVTVTVTGTRSDAQATPCVLTVQS